MAFDTNALLAAARLSVQNPRAAARAVMQMRLPTSTGWLAIAVMVAVSAVLSAVAFIVSPMADDPGMQELFGSPFRLALLQGVVLVSAVGLVHGVGRWFGGTGQLADALALMAWIEFLLILLQIVQIIALLALPPFAELLGLVGIGLSFWLMAHFVAELHGFKSAVMVFFGILATGVAVSLVLAVLMVMVMGNRG